MLQRQESDASDETNLVLHQIKYDSLDLAEFAMHKLEGQPDARHSAEIEMYTK